MKLTREQSMTLETHATALANFITTIYNFQNKASIVISQSEHSQIFDTLNAIASQLSIKFELRNRKPLRTNSTTNPKKEDSQ